MFDDLQKAFGDVALRHGITHEELGQAITYVTKLVGADDLRSDSQAPSYVSGAGGHDVLDLGADGGLFAIGDHNTFEAGSTAVGAGNDRIIGGAPNEPFLIGNDTLIGDNVNTNGTATVAAMGGMDRLFGGNAGDALRAGPANDFPDGDRKPTTATAKQATSPYGAYGSCRFVRSSGTRSAGHKRIRSRSGLKTKQRPTRPKPTQALRSRSEGVYLPRHR